MCEDDDDDDVPEGVNDRNVVCFPPLVDEPVVEVAVVVVVDDDDDGGGGIDDIDDIDPLERGGFFNKLPNRFESKSSGESILNLWLFFEAA
jgi:hypothetical protein